MDSSARLVRVQWLRTLEYGNVEKYNVAAGHCRVRLDSGRTVAIRYKDLRPVEVEVVVS
jgi:hypothetical protein